MFLAACLVGAWGSLYIKVAEAELSKKQEDVVVNKLREVATEFCKAYEKRKYADMYKHLIPEYRERVKLWEYKDFVTYPGVTDGYIKVEPVEAVIYDDAGKYGKVILKITIFENIRTKSTGKVTKKIQELMENQDWVVIDGKWYKWESME